MKRLLVLLLLVFVGIAGWRIGGRLSSDAISLALGLFLGVMAGVPTALLVLAAGRRRTDYDRPPTADRGHMGGLPYGAAAHQPPVIVVAPGGMPANLEGQRPAPDYYPAPVPGSWSQGPGTERRFKIVGEREEWVEEW